MSLDKGQALGLLAKVSDDGARAGDNLACLTSRVDLAEARPLSKLDLLRNREDRDVVLGGEGLDELGIVGLVAVVSEDDELGLALLNGTGSLVESTAESIMGKSLLEHNLQGRVDVQRLGGGSRCLDGGCLNNGGLSDVAKRGGRQRSER